MPLRFLSQIEQLPLFAGRARAEIEALLSGAEEKTCKHRDILFPVGEKASHFAVVVQGAFKLVKPTPDGRDIIIFFATPGEIVGGLLMSIPNSTYPVSAISMGHSLVLKIPRATYQRSWLADAAAQQVMGGILFSRMNLLHDQKTLTKAPLPAKVAHQLISLIERYCGESETILPIPLTRQEIADSVGASVESVIRIMSEWSQKGMIKTTDQMIEILRTDKLFEIIKTV